MFNNKKGINGMYYFIALIVGVVVGAALMYYLVAQGMLTPVL